jgi:large subunit ribosomal protein L11
MDFCKEFNARTADVEPGLLLPTRIDINPDRTFTFVTKTPTTSYFLKKCANIEKGTGKPGTEPIATISVKHIYEIARIKSIDVKDRPLEALARSVVATAKTLNIKVVL